MAERTARQIIREAEQLLETARFGLQDMTERPGRAMSGLRNAVVFGRNVTFALQNLRSVVPRFDDWYKIKQDEMREDKLMCFFRDFRNSIEKKAETRAGMHIKITYNKDVIDRLCASKPPGATNIFAGDSRGGAGWIIPKPDGSADKYYVDLPDDLGSVDLILEEAPEDFSDKTAANLLRLYLEKVSLIVEQAKENFL